MVHGPKATSEEAPQSATQGTRHYAAYPQRVDTCWILQNDNLFNKLWLLNPTPNRAFPAGKEGLIEF